MKGLIVLCALALVLGEACAPAAGPATLEQTYWKLVELGGKPVLAVDKSHEAHLQLAAAEKRAAGSSGCNRIMGSYELKGGSLRFSPMAATRMMCPGELMQQEAAFTSALQATTNWQISSDKLELRNEAGEVLARFTRTPSP